ncbi:MAG: hypothetical protein WB508_03795 [Aeromicrobium sp.]|uniref:hypothetical protein n=1 Tax=Aeromicrobium sp. TaxID=1871063 RepID=UPI003C39F581
MKFYRFLANSIAVLVLAQAGLIAWAFFGLANWIDQEGGVVNKALLECTDCDMNFTAEWGFAFHMFFIGLLLIPLISLILLITSFFAKVQGGTKYAAIIVVLVALQVLVFPELSRQFGAGFGALHGINALVILGTAIHAGRAASTASAAVEPTRV